MSKAAETAYEWVRNRILSGEFSPGTHLKEEGIADELNISRTPVREALRRLGNEHFVKFIPNRGASVVELVGDDVDDIFTLRVMLESYSAYRAATRITEDQIGELEYCADKIEELSRVHSRENHRRTIEFNHRFHTIIIEAASSERINKIISWLVEMPMLLKTIDKYSAADVERSNHHHRELISAFKARDGNWAKSVMESHIRAAHRIYTANNNVKEESR